MCALTTPVVALNLATMLASLAYSEQRGEHMQCSPRRFPYKWLLPAGNLHRFNVVGHVQLGKVRNALAQSESDLRTLKILILIRKHRRAGSNNDTLDIIVPNPSR
jgi:hypothetical protein